MTFSFCLMLYRIKQHCPFAIWIEWGNFHPSERPQNCKPIAHKGVEYLILFKDSLAPLLFTDDFWPNSFSTSQTYEKLNSKFTILDSCFYPIFVVLKIVKLRKPCWRWFWEQTGSCRVIHPLCITLVRLKFTERNTNINL